MPLAVNTSAINFSTSNDDISSQSTSIEQVQQPLHKDSSIANEPAGNRMRYHLALTEHKALCHSKVIDGLRLSLEVL